MHRDQGHSETMAYLGEKWGATLRDLKHLNNMTIEQYEEFIVSKVHRGRRRLDVFTEGRLAYT